MKTKNETAKFFKNLEKSIVIEENDRMKVCAKNKDKIKALADEVIKLKDWNMVNLQKKIGDANIKIHGFYTYQLENGKKIFVEP
jgi:hypothetical protein